MYLTRNERAGNMYHFYSMQIVRGLFDEWGLIREWGRVGSSIRVRTDWFQSEEDAKTARFNLLIQKSKKGYE